MGPDETKDVSANVPILSKEQPKHGLNFPAPAKEKKTAHELSVMILQDVMKMDGWGTHRSRSRWISILT